MIEIMLTHANSKVELQKDYDLYVERNGRPPAMIVCDWELPYCFPEQRSSKTKFQKSRVITLREFYDIHQELDKDPD